MTYSIYTSTSLHLITRVQACLQLGEDESHLRGLELYAQIAEDQVRKASFPSQH